MKQLEVRAALDGGEYTGLFDVIDARTGTIEELELPRAKAEKYVADYYNSFDKLMIFEPLTKELSPQQCRNIVESHLKAIRAQKRRKFRGSFSFWRWLMGDRDMNPGGTFDLNRDEL